MIHNKDGTLIITMEVDQKNYSKVVPLCVFDVPNRKKVCELKRKSAFQLSPDASVLTEDGKYFLTCTEVDFSIFISSLSKCFSFFVLAFSLTRNNVWSTKIRPDS